MPHGISPRTVVIAVDELTGDYIISTPQEPSRQTAPADNALKRDTEQPSLRATRHFVQEWRRRGAGDRLVLLRSVEPRNHRLDLLREIG